MSGSPQPLLAGTAVASGSAEAIELMDEAVRSAIGISGCSPNALDVDAVLVPAGTWPYEDPGRALANRMGWSGATSILGQLGVSQQELINTALEMITHGEAHTVIVVGGESRRWAATGTFQPLPGPPDVVLERPEHFIDELEIAAGLVFPAVRSYALIERAFDARHQIDEATARELNAVLWSEMSTVAAMVPGSLIDAPVSPSEIATQTATNRLLAAPYLRLHASQWTVDQAAALLVMDTETAQRCGVDPSAVIHPLVCLESTDVVPVIHRAELGRWPAMALLGEVAATRIGQPMAEIDLLDLYSCFPVAVRLQAEELDIPLDRPLSVTGGMTFGGGPFNNYVLGSTATLADRLRSTSATTGLITTVSGLLTKPGLAIWSKTPPEEPAQIADLGAEAARRTRRIPCTPLLGGQSLTIESSTAWAEDAETTAAIIGIDDEGDRRLAVRHDFAAFERFSASGCIGEQL